MSSEQTILSHGEPVRTDVSDSPNEAFDVEPDEPAAGHIGEHVIDDGCDAGGQDRMNMRNADDAQLAERCTYRSGFNDNLHFDEPLKRISDAIVGVMTDFVRDNTAGAHDTGHGGFPMLVAEMINIMRFDACFHIACFDIASDSQNLFPGGAMYSVMISREAANAFIRLLYYARFFAYANDMIETTREFISDYTPDGEQYTRPAEPSDTFANEYIMKDNVAMTSLMDDYDFGFWSGFFDRLGKLVVGRREVGVYMSDSVINMDQFIHAKRVTEVAYSMLYPRRNTSMTAEQFSGLRFNLLELAMLCMTADEVMAIAGFMVELISRRLISEWVIIDSFRTDGEGAESENEFTRFCEKPIFGAPAKAVFMPNNDALTLAVLFRARCELAVSFNDQAFSAKYDDLYMYFYMITRDISNTSPLRLIKQHITLY